MKTYYIDGYSFWYLVKAKNKKDARKDAVRECGRGLVKLLRLATEEEINYFTRIKGEIDEAEA